MQVVLEGDAVQGDMEVVAAVDMEVTPFTYL